MTALTSFALSTGKHFSAGMALETFAGSRAMDNQSPARRAAIWSHQQVREAVTAMKKKRAGAFTPLPALQHFKEIDKNGL